MSKEEIKNFYIVIRLGYMYLEDEIWNHNHADDESVKSRLAYHNYELLEIIIEALGYGSYTDEYNAIPYSISYPIRKMVENKYLDNGLSSGVVALFIEDLVDILEGRSPYNFQEPYTLEATNIPLISCEDIPF